MHQAPTDKKIIEKDDALMSTIQQEAFNIQVLTSVNFRPYDSL